MQTYFLLPLLFLNLQTEGLPEYVKTNCNNLTTNKMDCNEIVEGGKSMSCSNPEGSKFHCAASLSDVSSGREINSHDFVNRTWITSTMSALPSPQQSAALSALSTITVPDTWSWRDITNGGNKITYVRNQRQCGCCWAVASTTALADRFGVVHNKGAPDLSFGYTVSCIGPTFGGIPVGCQCDMGGSLQVAACGFARDGARLEKCYPSFNAVEGGSASVCPSSPCCATNPVFKIKSGSAHLVISGEPTNLRSVPTEDQEKATWELIKREIYSNGPLPTTIAEWVSSQNLQQYYNSILSSHLWHLTTYQYLTLNRV